MIFNDFREGGVSIYEFLRLLIILIINIMLQQLRPKRSLSKSMVLV